MMTQAIKTKDFRVLAIGTVLTQELRDEIFQALKDRDALAAGYGLPEPIVEAFKNKKIKRTVKGNWDRALTEEEVQKVTLNPGIEEDFSPPIDDSAESTKEPTNGDA